MSDLFKSSRRKIARAKEHILDLERQIRVFAGENPYKQIVEEDPQRPGYLLHKIKLTKSLAPSFSDLVGDAVSNMRAALDHACYALAASHKTKPINAYFPFARDAAGLESAIKGRSKDVPQEIHPLLRSFEPYKGGNEILWGLNMMCNADKHKMLTPVATGIVRPGTSIKGRGFFSIPAPPVWDRTKQEIVILTLGPGAQFDYKFNFVLYIAFDEIELVAGEPVRSILGQTMVEVERVVDAIDAESMRLGLIK
jgi:hypothetical protein